MKDITSYHWEEYSVEPEVIISAPGIVNLLGEHSGYSHGYALLIGINRYMQIALSQRDDNSLRFYSANFNERKRTSLGNVKYKREDRWANYLKGVIHCFINIGCPIKGLSITLLGEVPPDIGLSSSEAMEVALGFALCELYGFDCSDLQVIECARKAEISFIGKKTGIIDHFACLNAEQDTALFIDTGSMEYSYLPFQLDNLRIIITDSKIPQVFTREDPEHIFEECIHFVSAIGRNGGARNLQNLSSKEVRQSLGQIPEKIRRKCLHLIEENQRVKDGKNAIMRKDWYALGKLLKRSHVSLRDLYEVSCPELDWLVKHSWDIEGVYGSRITGFGGGGCTISLIREDALDIYQKQLREYDRIFGFSPEIHLCETSSGVGSKKRILK
jgi:galactokinase